MQTNKTINTRPRDGRHIRRLATVVALATALSAAVGAEEFAPSVVLLELFTSQGCYSCPPAEALVHDDYAKRRDALPLEFHVDYWNDLVYGSAGSWEDPFSSAEYTQRQRAYNIKLRRTGSVFTPQMVVQGRHQGGGTQKGRIDGFIQKESERENPLRFYFDGDASSGLQARLDGVLQGSEQLYYAVYSLEETTQIPSGENKGKTLTSSHVVTKINGQKATQRRVSLPPIDPEKEGCAVWVQKPGTGWILSAARCPTDV